MNILIKSTNIESISLAIKKKIKAAPKVAGKQHIDFPSKAIFIIKFNKYKLKIIVCSNKTHERYGKIATIEFDIAMMRYLVSWGVASPDFAFAFLDVTNAFLNVPLPENREVILKPPSIVYKLQLMPPSHAWLVHKTIYGLREVPNLWLNERTESTTKIKLRGSTTLCSSLRFANLSAWSWRFLL